MTRRPSGEHILSLIRYTEENAADRQVFMNRALHLDLQLREYSETSVMLILTWLRFLNSEQTGIEYDPARQHLLFNSPTAFSTQLDSNRNILRYLPLKSLTIASGRAVNLTQLHGSVIQTLDLREANGGYSTGQ